MMRASLVVVLVVVLLQLVLLLHAHLAGALVYLGDARVAVVPLHGVVSHVPCPSQGHRLGILSLSRESLSLSLTQVR